MYKYDIHSFMVYMGFLGKLGTPKPKLEGKHGESTNQSKIGILSGEMGGNMENWTKLKNLQPECWFILIWAPFNSWVPALTQSEVESLSGLGW